MSIDTLLNRPVNRDDHEALLHAIAEPLPRGASKATLLMVVRIGTEAYALETSTVARVLPAQPIHPIPRRGAAICGGLVNLEGELTLCAPLAALLGLGATAENANSSGQRLVALRASEGLLCVLVDEVCTVVSQETRTLLPVPVTNTKGSYASCRGLFEWNNTLIALLDSSVLAQRLERGFA